jgi:hypothetical protein
MGTPTKAEALSWQARGRRQLVAGTVGLTVLSAVAVGGIAVAANQQGSAGGTSSGTSDSSSSSSTQDSSSTSVTSTNRSSTATSSGS